MTLGALGFLNPWLLAGLVLLPVIWWLLRTTPPQPRRVRFPATRFLKGLLSPKHTPARSPWWLTLLRMLAASLIIFALAEPLLNPKARTLAGSGPVVLAIDNDWAAAPHWDQRQTALANLIAEAERQARPVMVAPTASGPQATVFSLQAPASARENLAALQPAPYAPNRLAAAEAIAKGLGTASEVSIVWLSDGADHGNARAFVDRLNQIAGSTGQITMMAPDAGSEPVALRLAAATGDSANTLAIEAARTEGPPRAVSVRALSGRGLPLGEARLSFAGGATQASGKIELPLELRNQVMRLEVMGERSAGAVHLLDSGSRWNRVGVVSGTGLEQSQPLLAPLFYLERALGPYSQVVKSDDTNSAAAISSLLQQNVSVLMLADIGKLTGSMAGRVMQWIEGGGVLVRFAGPRLEDGGDELLPVTLRLGGRSLGGALSWDAPQPLGPFEENSLFAGLTASEDVRVTRQVLADPALLSDRTRIWARLADGTPLVTATRRQDGWIVLFHVTANPDWSNLPLSGLFVEMLRRVIRLTGLADIEGAAVSDLAETAAVGPGAILAPTLTLDGFGDGVPPPVTAEPLALATLAGTQPDATHPPGIYGPPGASVALNVFGPASKLEPVPGIPATIRRAAYGVSAAQSLKPLALSLAMALILLDVIAILLLQSGLRLWAPRNAAAALFLGIMLTSGLAVTDSRAQTAADDFALRAAVKTRLAFVLTGDTETDETSRAGLFGLSLVLAARTAVEPDAPIGVDVDKDELAFFPILYWPVRETAAALTDATLARIDAFMKGGGLIIFDTRDAADAQLSFDGAPTPGSEALTRLVAKLDVPRLEPAPPGHVVTKAFYLLKSFPEINLIGQGKNGLEAVQMIKDLSPDLVFLDVQMPGLDGFGVGALAVEAQALAIQLDGARHAATSPP
mgnify:FL=1